LGRRSFSELDVARRGGQSDRATSASASRLRRSRSKHRSAQQEPADPALERRSTGEIASNDRRAREATIVLRVNVRGRILSLIIPVIQISGFALRDITLHKRAR
jgi:hypothetical protein